MFDLGLDKFRKRNTLAQNRMNGRMAENSFVMSQRLQGNIVERTGRGHDYKVTRQDIWTGHTGRPTYVEVKSSSTAPLSDLQKRRQAQMGSRYKVHRQNGFF